MIWNVSWQKKFYDYKRLISDYKNGRHHGFIEQRKGMARMCVVPHIGDEVYISCNKLKIMKCRVVSEFVENENHIFDNYNIMSDELREQHRNNIFLMIQIIEVYDEPERMLGHQRTWVKSTN